MNQEQKDKILDAIEAADWHFALNIGKMLRYLLYEENHGGKIRPGLIDNLVRAINETTEIRGPEGEGWIDWDGSKVEPLINELRKSLGKEEFKFR